MTDPLPLDYAPRGIDSQTFRPPWRGVLALILLVAVPFTGEIPLSTYILDPAAYVLPMIFVPVAGMVGWRAVRSKIRMDKILGFPALAAAILLIAFIISDRFHYILK